MNLIHAQAVPTSGSSQHKEDRHHYRGVVTGVSGDTTSPILTRITQKVHDNHNSLRTQYQTTTTDALIVCSFPLSQTHWWSETELDFPASNLHECFTKHHAGCVYDHQPTLHGGTVSTQLLIVHFNKLATLRVHRFFWIIVIWFETGHHQKKSNWQFLPDMSTISTGCRCCF